MDSQKDKPMNFRNRIIGMQLKLGLGVLLLFVSVQEEFEGGQTDQQNHLKCKRLK
jgi:hypothetical protein